MSTGFEAHAIIELMGHNQIAGKVSEQTIAGAALLRVDVPKTSRQEGYTKFYSAGAIYCITPTTEEIVQAVAERLVQPPVDRWVLISNAMLAAKVDGGDDDEFDEEDLYLRHLVEDAPEDEEEPEPASSTPTIKLTFDDIDDQERDKRAAAEWARDLLKTGFVVLDTETTGLNKERADEPVQIAIIDHTGKVLLDTLIKPTFPIPAEAIQIHGITDEAVKDAPSFAAIRGQFVSAIEGQPVAVYNADYDLRIVNNVAQGDPWLHAKSISCVMLRYAAFYGDWNDYHGSYRWQSLVNACRQQGIEFSGPAHSALADCQMTLALIKKMAEYQPVEG